MLSLGYVFLDRVRITPDSTSATVTAFLGLSRKNEAQAIHKQSQSQRRHAKRNVKKSRVCHRISTRSLRWKRPAASISRVSEKNIIVHIRRVRRCLRRCAEGNVNGIVIDELEPRRGAQAQARRPMKLLTLPSSLWSGSSTGSSSRTKLLTGGPHWRGRQEVRRQRLSPRALRY
jgi:hypothetical protein